jgi:hypothetical protein
VLSVLNLVSDFVKCNRPIIEPLIPRLTLFQVVNPMIHCCDKCCCPILIYGRMIPCKHVFCLQCAQAQMQQQLQSSSSSSPPPAAAAAVPAEIPPATCSRCDDKVVRVEQAGLGSIFMCSHGGTREEIHQFRFKTQMNDGVCCTPQSLWCTLQSFWCALTSFWCAL